jgi:hypothetical protein
MSILYDELDAQVQSFIAFLMSSDEPCKLFPFAMAPSYDIRYPDLIEFLLGLP